ncbi:hypothetical protein V8G54_003273, partial [Vigna mungo]
MVTLETRSGGADLKFAILDFRTYLQVRFAAKANDFNRKILRAKKVSPFSLFLPFVNAFSSHSHNRVCLFLRVLSDDEKQSIYDKFGEAGLKGSRMRMRDFSNPFDLFKSLFKGMNRGAGSRGWISEEGVKAFLLLGLQVIVGDAAHYRSVYLGFLVSNPYFFLSRTFSLSSKDLVDETLKRKRGDDLSAVVICFQQQPPCNLVAPRLHW